MDSTFIQEEVIDLLADEAGVGEQVAQITERAMRGELDFRESLQERVALLQGLHEETFQRVRSRIHLSNGATILVNSLHEAGSYVGVVSGGFENIIAPILAEVGVDFYKANTLEIKDGVLTGKIVGPIIDKFAKREFLEKYARECGIEMSHTVAVGDGANDLEMMSVAGLSVAFNAKPIVQQSANKEITTGNLAQILDFLDIPLSALEK